MAEDIHLEGVLQGIGCATTPHQAVQAFTRLAWDFGFGAAFHIGLNNPDGTLMLDGDGGFMGAMSRWRDHYFESGYLPRDPIAETLRTQRSGMPLTWQLSAPPPSMTAQQEAVFHAAGEFGIGSGVSVPCRGGDGMSIVALFGGARSLPALSGVEMAALTYAALLLDGRLAELLSPEPRSAPSVRLTVRELECLRGVMMGHTVPRIADALAISERTVNFHLGHVRRKLGTRTTAHAIVRAVSLGLIEPA